MLTTNYKKILKDYVKKEANWLLSILLVSVIYSICTLVTPRITQKIIDVILPHYNSALFWKFVVFLMGSYLLTIVLSVLKNYLSSKINENVKRNLRLDLLNKMMYINYIELDKKSLGDFVSKYENEVEIIAANCGVSIVQVITNFLYVLITCIAIYMINKPVLLTTIGVIGIYLVNNFWWGKRINKLSEQSLEATNDSLNLFSDIYNNKLIVKIHNLYKKLNIKFKDMYARQYKTSIRLKVTYYLNAYAGVALVYFLIVLVWLIGGIFYFEGEFSIGEIITLTSYVGMLISPINEISGFFNGYKETLVAVNRWYDLIELPKEKLKNKVCISDISKIEWKNVAFEYNNLLVIKSGNFIVQKNSIVGIIGSSGSGKSTITKLLLRLIENERGKILLDDIDIKDISIETLRKNITYVPQESLFFNDSIKENMFMEDVKKQYEQFRILSGKLQLLEFIDDLPEQWDFMIQTNGNNLSGGQKKRLDIIRSFLLDTPVQIFDEPTASLDLVSCKNFYRMLEANKKGKIIFVVTHNENEIKYFDKIIRVHDGMITEEKVIK